MQVFSPKFSNGQKLHLNTRIEGQLQPSFKKKKVLTIDQIKDAISNAFCISSKTFELVSIQVPYSVFTVDKFLVYLE